MPKPALSLFPVRGLPLIESGDKLVEIIAAAIRKEKLQPEDGDIFAVAQKIVSKSEDRRVDLRNVSPSTQATELANSTDKDPRLVELILSESRRVVRHGPGVIIVEHRLGIVLANAGIDRSNLDGGNDIVLLLPEDPDASARALKQGLEQEFQASLGILIVDSIGRPWRLGTTGVAIGCAGLTVLDDFRGNRDIFGRILEVAATATADCAAGAASLVMGEGNEAVPVVLVRGLNTGETAQDAATLVRPENENLFR